MRDLIPEWLAEPPDSAARLMEAWLEPECVYSIGELRRAARLNLTEETAIAAGMTLRELAQMVGKSYWPDERQMRMLAHHLRIAPR